MSDEDKLHQAIDRGARAERLIADDLLTDGFKALEDAYAQAWRSTASADTAGREKLYLAINIVGKVRDHLGAVAANGKLAQAELKQIVEMGERRKLFGVI